MLQAYFACALSEMPSHLRQLTYVLTSYPTVLMYKVTASKKKLPQHQRFGTPSAVHLVVCISIRIPASRTLWARTATFTSASTVWLYVVFNEHFFRLQRNLSRSFLWLCLFLQDEGSFVSIAFVCECALKPGRFRIIGYFSLCVCSDFRGHDPRIERRIWAYSRAFSLRRKAKSSSGETSELRRAKIPPK